MLTARFDCHSSTLEPSPRSWSRDSRASTGILFLFLIHVATVFGQAPSTQPSIGVEVTVVAHRFVPPTIEFEAGAGFDPNKDLIVAAMGTNILTPISSPVAIAGTERFSLGFRNLSEFPSDARPHVWRVQREAIALLANSWPHEAPFISTVDSVGPAGESVWIRAGTNAGIHVGQSWWRRVNGQPHLRFDVRFVSEDVCHCRCIRLAAGARVASGDAVELWPGPGDIREGRLRSAVSYIDTGQDDPFVWLPRIKPTMCPADPRFDFYRNGEYVGYGVAERADERFWYVRLLKQAGTSPLQIGDDAICRTFQDAAAGRIRARVFAKSKEGWLVSAGEAEGLKPGQTGTAYRKNQRLGSVELRRVQEAYCTTSDVFAPTDSKNSSPSSERPALQLLDEIRFDPQPPHHEPTARIRSIASGGFIVASLGNQTPLNQCLLIEDEGRVVGVAAIFAIVDGAGVGMILGESLLAPAKAGQTMHLPN